MPDTEMIVMTTLMGLLFLRQFAVFKQASKINYAPLILILGALGALLHLMLHPQEAPLVLLREALIPVGISLVLYLILNILNQTQHSNRVLQQQEFQRELLREIDAIKQDMVMLNEREYHLDDIHTRSDPKAETTLTSDTIESLRQIQKNQEILMTTFGKSMRRYDKSMQDFEAFTKVKMPEFDAIIHRHIEMLRMTEQDHFNQLKETLGHYKASSHTFEKRLQEITKMLLGIQHTHKDIAGSAVKQAGSELQRLFSSYETRLSHLNAGNEELGQYMRDNAVLLERLKSRSESLLKAVTLVSETMDTMAQTAKTLPNLEHYRKSLLTQQHQTHEDMLLLKEEIAALKARIDLYRDDHEQTFEDALRMFSAALNEKTDAAISKLNEQYFALQNANTSTIKELASRSKIEKTYRSNSQE